MITLDGKPVDLVSKVEKDGFSMSVFALFDVLLIALMFSFLASKFVLAPGFPVDIHNEPMLPTIPQESLVGELVSDEVSVLNLLGKDTIFFDGKIYNEDSFARVMQAYTPKGKTLLLKTDHGVSAQTLMKISAIAKTAGFERIHLAAVADSER